MRACEARTARCEPRNPVRGSQTAASLACEDTLACEPHARLARPAVYSCRLSTERIRAVAPVIRAVGGPSLRCDGHGRARGVMRCRVWRWPPACPSGTSGAPVLSPCFRRGHTKLRNWHRGHALNRRLLKTRSTVTSAATLAATSDASASKAARSPKAGVARACAAKARPVGLIDLLHVLAHRSLLLPSDEFRDGLRRHLGRQIA